MITDAIARPDSSLNLLPGGPTNLEALGWIRNALHQGLSRPQGSCSPQPSEAATSKT